MNFSCCVDVQMFRCSDRPEVRCGWLFVRVEVGIDADVRFDSRLPLELIIFYSFIFPVKSDIPYFRLACFYLRGVSNNSP